jgi:hypothetical protein
MIDYEIGDEVESYDGVYYGKVTGFSHDNTCVEVNGEVQGGKQYFRKCSFDEYEIVEQKQIK